MMVRALIIGVNERKAIDDLRARATATVIDAAAAVTQDPEQVRAANDPMTIGLPRGFTVTYTIERQPFGLARHLSVSVDAPHKAPNVHAVEMILEAFGMQPLAKSFSVWKEDVTPSHVAINVLQRLTDDEGHA